MAADATRERPMEEQEAVGGESERAYELEAELARTRQQLAHRDAELDLINSIQQGLVKQLDFQAIIDLVGDKIGEIFAADSTSICLFDRDANLLNFPYSVERGHHLDPEPRLLGSGLTSRVIETRGSVVFGTQETADELGALWVPVPDHPDEQFVQSYLGVPILVGDEVMGVVDIQSYEQHAYDEGHVRLLSTITASLSVALENARLFEETNRLLEETEQRNAELSLINKVQQGLAWQLDFQGITRLVGDEVRDIFDAEVIHHLPV